MGIDYLGIERDQPDHISHKVPELDDASSCVKAKFMRSQTLLGSNIPIIEGLRLAHVEAEREYHFVCLPLAIRGLEAAPARAVLIPL